MRRELVAVLCLLFFETSIYSQWTEVERVKIDGIEHYDFDPSGSLYIATANGSIVKYGQDGGLLLDYSPVRIAPIDDLKISTQLKVFLFYEGLQEVVILDRWLRAPVNYRLGDFDLGFITNICPNQQQNIWTLDMSDYSLKLIDPTRGLILEVKSLAQVLGQKMPDVSYFRSHENLMYLGFDHRLLVFDVMGNIIKDIRIGVENFNMFREKIYWVESNKLQVLDVFTGIQSEYDLPQKGIEEVLYNTKSLIVFSKEGFTIYKLS